MDTDQTVGNPHENLRNALHAALDRVIGHDMRQMPQNISITRGRVGGRTIIGIVHEVRDIPLLAITEVE